MAVKGAQHTGRHWCPRAHSGCTSLYGGDTVGLGMQRHSLRGRQEPGVTRHQTVWTLDLPDHGDLTAAGAARHRKALPPEAVTVPVTEVDVPPSTTRKQTPTGLLPLADPALGTVPGTQGIRMTGTHAQPGGWRTRSSHNSPGTSPFLHERKCL